MTHIELIITGLIVGQAIVLVGWVVYFLQQTRKNKNNISKLRRDLDQAKEHYDPELSAMGQSIARLDQRISALYKPPVAQPHYTSAPDSQPRQDKQECQIDSSLQDIVPTLSAGTEKTRKRGVNTWLSGLLRFFNRKK